MALKTTLNEEVGQLDLGGRVGEVTVVFGNGVPALRGLIVGRRADYFVLEGAAAGTTVKYQHLVRWDAVAYIRRENNDDL